MYKTSKLLHMNNDNSLEKDYHISFFNPTTKLAQFNKKLILTLFSVWAISIFGFQILLKVVEKPTPEKAYTNFEEVWGNVKQHKASVAEKQIFVQSALSVLGKVTLAAEDRVFLDDAINQTIKKLIPNKDAKAFNQKVKNFKAVSFGDDNYLQLKADLGSTVATYIGVTPYSLAAKLVPLELKEAQGKATDNQQIERIMSKYLIHNQSFLTDFTVLGFPFHYFYTTVFLLILFVGLCLYYCIATDRKMLELGIEE